MTEKTLLELIKKTSEDLHVPENVYKTGLAVLKAESGLKPDALNVDQYGTCDFGIAQFNSLWYWSKKKVIHPKDALDPYKALPVFWKMFQINPYDWVTYRTGKYKEFLK